MLVLGSRLGLGLGQGLGLGLEVRLGHCLGFSQAVGLRLYGCGEGTTVLKCESNDTVMLYESHGTSRLRPPQACLRQP